MELRKAARTQLLNLLSENRRRDNAATFDIVIKTAIGARQPGRNLRTALGRHALDTAEGRRRHDAGDDRNADRGRDAAIAKACDGIIVEAELAKRARRAGIDLALQQIDIVLERWRVRMTFGIAGNADLERCDLAQGGNEFGRGGIAALVRTIMSAHLRHVAAQRHDVADACVPIALHHLLDLAPSLTDPGP